MATAKPESVLYSLTMENSRALVNNSFNSVYGRNSKVCPNSTMVKMFGSDIFSETTLCMGCEGSRVNACDYSSSIRDSIKEKDDLVNFYKRLLEMEVLEKRGPVRVGIRGLVAQMLFTK